MIMKCPQCKSKMDKKSFNIGYDISINSLHCKNCGFNITNNKELKPALIKLQKLMSKEVKVVRIGAGLGIRLSNDIIKGYRLKFGENVILKPEIDGVKVLIERN